jgi:hypothetical protein
MNPASKSPLSVVLDPVAAAICSQLKQRLEANVQHLATKEMLLVSHQQAPVRSEMLGLKLKEELRLEPLLSG